MIRIIFKNTFLVGMLVLAICAVLFFGMQYTQVMDSTYAVLRQEAAYVEQGLKSSGMDYFQGMESPDRILWTDASGAVLYDSEPSGHASEAAARRDIQNALDSGEGQGVLHPEKGGPACVCYAKRCADGTVVSFSRPVSAVRTALLSASPVLWVLVLVLLIASTFAFRASRQIMIPINNLDLDHPKENPYPELRPLLNKIEEQKLTIKEEASSREAMRREFSANVSHELKTPLTSISGFAELMAQGVVSEDKVVEFSNDIYKESQRLIALIDDIIKLSRLDEEAIVPKKDRVDLRELSLDVISSLQNVANRNNISMEVSGGPVVINGVYQLLYEMIFNLCDNAIKYNYPGGSVTVELSSDERQAVLSVVDTGIGIGKEHQKRVFERFYRVDKSHSREIGGTGLGLSIVKHGAMYHHAEVELSSEEGAGTRVTLTFPYGEEEEPARKNGNTEER